MDSVLTDYDAQRLTDLMTECENLKKLADDANIKLHEAVKKKDVLEEKMIKLVQDATPEAYSGSVSDSTLEAYNSIAILLDDAEVKVETITYEKDKAYSALESAWQMLESRMQLLGLSDDDLKKFTE